MKGESAIDYKLLMPEQPNEDRSSAQEKKLPVKKSEDSPKRDYYYDDAHGYKTFDPDADDEDGLEAEKKPGQNGPV